MYQSYLRESLNHSSFIQAFKEILDYAVFPPGKLFRPQLVETLASDLNISCQDYLHLGTGIELHHAYSLVHDDLPCMDNDIERRGKPSTHVAFGEWKAVLAGDSLLIESFKEITKITSVNPLLILKVFFWATSGKGLIAGQFLDLSANKKKSIQDIIKIHELKTSRLIQVATIGTYLLSTKTYSVKKISDFMRFGRDIGLAFQFLDDLGELTTSEISTHENEINPFLSIPEDSFSELLKSLKSITLMLEKYQLKRTHQMLRSYFKNNKNSFLEKSELITSHLKKEFDSHKFSELITSLETF